MSRFLHLGLALILLVSLLMAALALPVMAQGGTVLAVDPAQASVEVNGQRNPPFGDRRRKPECF